MAALEIEMKTCSEAIHSTAGTKVVGQKGFGQLAEQLLCSPQTRHSRQ
jgi:hypothetical protein